MNIGSVIEQKRKDATLSMLMTRASETTSAPFTLPYERTSDEAAVQTSASGGETEAPAVPATEADVAQGMPSLDGTMSDAEAEAVFEKLTGCWNTADGSRFFCVQKQADGRYLLTVGNWFSEADLFAYLQSPVRGDPNGEVSVHLFYAPEGDGGGMNYGGLDTDVRADLTKANNGTVLWLFESGWESFRYAGATMDEATPQ